MAGRIPAGKIVTDIDLNNVNAVRSLRELRDSVKSATSAWKAQTVELRSAGKATEAAEAKYKGLSQSVETQRKYVDTLRAEIKRYSDIQKSANTSTKEGKRDYDNATEALKKTENQLGSASTKLQSLSKQQERAKKSADYYKSGLADVQKNLKLNTAETKAYVQNLASAGKKYEASRAQLNGYKQELVSLTEKQKIQSKELSDIASKTGATSKAYREQRVRVLETKTSINQLNSKIKQSQAEVNKLKPTGFNRITAGAKRVVKASDKMKSSLHNAWDNMKAGAATVATAIGSVGAVALNGAKKAGDLQQRYKEITNLAVNGGEKQREVTRAVMEMQRQGQNMSIRYGKSQQDIADAYEELVKRGYTTKQALGAMKSELQASVASGDDFKDVVSVSSTVLESFGMRADSTAQMTKNTTRATNELAYAADMTSTGFKDLGYGMSYVGASAHQAGFSLSETASAMGILSNNGLEASKAGTGLNQVINRLSDSAGKLAKGDKRNVLAKLGIKPREIMDSNGKLKSLAAVFGVLNKHMKGMSKVQKINIMKSLFGVNGEQAGLILAKYNKQLGDLSKKTLEAGKNGKYIANLSAKNSETAKMQVARAKMAFDAFSVTLGKKMLPAINEAGQGLVVFLTKNKDGKKLMNDMADAVSTLANGLVSLIKWASTHRTEVKWIFGGLLAGWSIGKGAKFISWLGDIKAAYSKLPAAGKIARIFSKGFKGLGKIGKGAGKGLLKGIKAGVKGIGKLGKLSFTALKKGFGKLTSFGKSLGSQLVNGFKTAVAKIPSITRGLFGKGNGAGKLNGLLQSAHSAGGFKNLTTAGKIGTVAAGAGVAVDTATSIVKAIHDKVGSRKQYEDIGASAGKGIGGAIGLWFGGPAGAAIGAKIGGTVGKWAGDAAKKFQNGWNAKKPPKKFWSLENLGWSTHDMINKVGKWGRNTAKSFGKGLNNAKKGISSFGKNISKGVNGGMNKTAKAFKKGWNTIYKHSSKGTRQIMRGVKTFGKSYVKNHEQYQRAISKNFALFGKRLKKNHGNLLKTIGQTAKTQLKITARYWQKNWNATAKFAKSIWGGLTKNARSMYNNLNKDTHGGLGKAMRGFHNFGNMLGKFWKNLWNGIFSFFDKTVGKIADGVGKLGNIIGKFTSGKLKVGSLHLANGTDWKRKYPVPAILNDGNDSPSTGNREGILHKNGVIELVNGTNVRRWLSPDDEVINAHDMATMFGSALHLANGTVKFKDNRGLIGLLNIATQILQLLGGKTPKEKSAKQTNSSSHSAVEVNSLAKASDKAVKNLKSKGNFTKVLSSMTKKSNKDISKFAKKYPENLKKANDKSQKDLQKFTKDYQTTWKKHWDATDKTYDKWRKNTDQEQKSFNGKFEKGFKSLGDGTGRIYSHFWSSMHKTAGKGLNNVISVVNSGISRIDSVIHQFGGSASAVHRVGGVRYATGTGAFSGIRRAITQPTLAIVNDGNDSPETGNREALWRPQTGELGIFQGRNVPAMLMPGDEILNASETKALGLTHFASGTGALKQLYELTKKFYKNSAATLKQEFRSAGINSRGAMRQMARGAFDFSRNQAQDWWSTLWSMVHKKIEDSDGPASGLLKAVEKYGEGHRYVWATAGPTTFDCSGLVMYALKKAYGISYPHYSGAQYARTQHISRASARPGDLVFWGAGGGKHVGVYAGGNKYFSAQSPAQGIHMNTLSSVVGEGRPLFGRVRGINAQGSKSVKVKANTALEKLVRSQVGQGFWKTIQKLADKYGMAGQYGNPAGDGVARWRPYVIKALKANGFSAAPYQVRAWMKVIARESGGNPHAVNNWDSNARAGIPSKGLVQTIGPTFNAYKFRGHGNIFNGYDDLLAGINYMKHKYGRGASAFARVSGPEGYANGGIATQASIFGEAGPEMAIPLIPSKSTRAWELIGKTIGILTGGSGSNQINEQEFKKEQKEQKQFNQDILNALNLIASLLADQKIETKVDIDGCKVGEAVSQYTRRANKRSIISQQRGYANGI